MEPGTARTPRRAGPDLRSLPRHPAGSIAVPFVIAAFDELVERDTRWAEHSHPTHELLWNERGASQVTVGPRTWTITPTVGLWMPAGVVHAGTAPSGTWYRTTHVEIGVGEAVADAPAAVEITPLLRLLLERLADASLAARSREITEALVLDVLAPSERELSVHLPRSSLLAPIVQAVMSRPGEAGSLAAWADRLGVSTRTISRAFRAETGLGFARWVATVRAQRAMLLLSRGERIEDVADELGYGSMSAFGAAFRRTTGFTPSAFRCE